MSQVPAHCSLLSHIQESAAASHMCPPDRPCGAEPQGSPPTELGGLGHHPGAQVLIQGDVVLAFAGILLYLWRRRPSALTSQPQIDW